MFSLTIMLHLSDAFVVALIGNACMFIQNIVLGHLILHCLGCVVLVLIPDLSIFHEFLLSHSVCRVLFYF